LNDLILSVMAGLVPAIHVLLSWAERKKDVDARPKAGHDVERFVANPIIRIAE
jgi:hypothetical protein